MEFQSKLELLCCESSAEKPLRCFVWSGVTIEVLPAKNTTLTVLQKVNPCLRKILRKCGGFKAPFLLLNFYFMEISNNGIKSLFLPSAVSDIFHKPHIQNLLSNLKLVTKSTGAIIGLNMNGFSLFLMFLGSNIPFFLLITRLQPLLCTTELYWRN